MKNHKLLIFMMVLLPLALHQTQTKETNFNFPIKPGQLEWKSIGSHKERLEKLQIPVNLLKKLPTDTLLNICLDYPFLNDIWAYNSIKDGFEAVKKDFNGLEEILTREDVGNKLFNKYKGMEVKMDKEWSLIEQWEYKAKFVHVEIMISQDCILKKMDKDFLASLLEETIKKYKLMLSKQYTVLNAESIAYLMGRILLFIDNTGFNQVGETEKKINDFLEKPSHSHLNIIEEIYNRAVQYLKYNYKADKIIFLAKINSVETDYVYTPRGTPVDAGLGWGDFTEEIIYALNQYVLNYYDDVEIVSDASQTYNCFGYAWHMSEGGSTAWIFDQSDYMTDGSYDLMPGETNSTKVKYQYAHAAITTDQQGIYISKWGVYPLVKHAATNCPGGYGSPVAFYRRSVDVPQDYSTIASAISATVSGQTVNVSNYQTLSGNTTVPNGVTLNLMSTATINLNNYSITTTNGTITVESGADIYGAFLKTGSTINGIYSSIQSAVNSRTTNQTVSILDGTHDENITVNGKNNIVIRSNSSNYNNCIIDGSITIVNSSGAYVGALTANEIYISGSPNTELSAVVIESASQYDTENLTTYNSSGLYLSGIMASGFNNSRNPLCIDGSSGYISDLLMSNNGYAITMYNSSNFSVGDPEFCNNTYDIAAYSSSSATLANSVILSDDPQYCMIGNVDVDDYEICSLKKRGSLIVQTEKDPLLNEFVEASRLYHEINKKMLPGRSTDSQIDKEKYSSELEPAINNLKSFMDKNPSSVFAGTALSTIVHAYKQFDKYEEMNSFLSEVMGDKNLSSLGNKPKRFLIDYYSYQKDYPKALSIADEILQDKATDSDLLCDVLFSKGLIYEYSLDNQEQAIEIYTDLVKNYPDNSLTSLAKKQLANLGQTVPEAEPKIAAKESTEIGFSSGNYPNPFNPSTTISYTLPEDGKVLIKVFDVLGREVTTLVNEFTTAGKHNVVWDGSNFTSGIYFYSIIFKNQTLYKKMLLMK